MMSSRESAPKKPSGGLTRKDSARLQKLKGNKAEPAGAAAKTDVRPRADGQTAKPAAQGAKSALGVSSQPKGGNAKPARPDGPIAREIQRRREANAAARTQGLTKPGEINAARPNRAAPERPKSPVAKPAERAAGNPWLLMLHDRLLDHRDAPKERVPTGAPFLRAPSRPLPAISRSTPRMMIRQALLGLPEGAEGFTFVDLGCGTGRVLYEASRLPFERIVGIERDEERYEAAMANMRLWPRSVMACRDVDIYHDNVLDIELPEGDLVVYIYGLFNRRSMSFIANRLSRHARETDRVYLLYADPLHGIFFENSPSFEHIPFPSRQRLLLKYLSPFPMLLYRVGPSFGRPAAASGVQRS